MRNRRGLFAVAACIYGCAGAAAPARDRSAVASPQNGLGGASLQNGLPAAPAATPARQSFQCTLLLGVAVTSEWFEAGFEQAVDDARWEAIMKPHTSLEQWADPNDPVWSLAPSSACAAHAAEPDRVLFTGMDWHYTTSAEWEKQLAAVINVIKTKYPSVRDIELLSMIRAPGNKSCGNDMSVVAPFIDEAITKVSAGFPGLAHPGPKFEVKSCEVFKNGGPHFTPEGRPVVAKIISGHYAEH